jgi:two-component system chemotaxis sensor kinase CheA
MQIRVPLTMAIIDAIIFTIGNNYFAIPMDEVKEFISEEKDNAFFIEGGKEFIKLRGKTMPVVKLDEMFETQSIPDRDAATYIVISRGKCTAAFVVDKIIGNKQLVIKSMPGFLKETNKLKGCSIIGNGDVCMILNTTEIVKKQRFEMNDFAVENETATV